MNVLRSRSTKAALACVTAGSALIASVALATPGNASPEATRILRLTASAPTTSSFFIPCQDCVLQSNPDGAHIGGTEIDAGTLADSHGTVVGHYALNSVGATPFTQDGPGEVMQNAYLVIGSDQLVVAGVEEPPLDGGVGAITGGTGRFRNARGELRYTDNDNGTTTLTIVFSD